MIGILHSQLMPQYFLRFLKIVLLQVYESAHIVLQKIQI